MSKALRTRIRRAFTFLLDTGSAYGVAKLAADGMQGLGVAGLRGRRPKTDFEIVFTAHPEYLENCERQAGVDVRLHSGPSLFLACDSDPEMTEIRHYEQLANLPVDHRWSSRRSQGFTDGEDDIWLHDWLSSLMDDCPAVDHAVRQALIGLIDHRLLEEVEDDIEVRLREIAEDRWEEA